MVKLLFRVRVRIKVRTLLFAIEPLKLHGSLKSTKKTFYAKTKVMNIEQ